MFQKLFYEEKGSFLQTLHPGVALLYLGVLFTLALLFSHPLYLIGIFVISALLVVASGVTEKWEFYLEIGVWMSLFVMVINPLVYHSGKTVLWHGPTLPVLGKMDICLEAICYGAVMGVRLLAVLTVFCLYTAVVHPDKVLNLFSRFFYRSALVVSLATRMLPAIARDLSSACEVQQLRGVDFASGRLKERVRKYSWLLNIVLLSSLEGALQIAEAMEARAFGSGPRSCYQRQLTRPRDYLCCAAGITGLLLALYAKFQGYGDFAYYPQLGDLFEGPATVVWLGIILGALSLPVALSWGWKYCPSLRSRI
ncbi:MAG: ABC-type cobalt transport system, permease component CbiQ [Thermoanaerobacterales bacterium 50_218]|nr:MAG: ABC-type cobalt transport system, permease component CbiQ [Thermoanaerobacterales bacterium 50_218]HAA89561.1 energy-coupling factor transporter transmembrane protein EcfT [Peptococcaceae bacterium]